MNKKHLYFFIGRTIDVNGEEHFVYKYYLANTKQEAYEEFHLKFPNYEVYEGKTIYERGKLRKLYDDIDKRTKK